MAVQTLNYLDQRHVDLDNLDNNQLSYVGFFNAI